MSLNRLHSRERKSLDVKYLIIRLDGGQNTKLVDAVYKF